MIPWNYFSFGSVRIPCTLSGKQSFATLETQVDNKKWARHFFWWRCACCQLCWLVALTKDWFITPFCFEALEAVSCCCSYSEPCWQQQHHGFTSFSFSVPSVFLSSQYLDGWMTIFGLHRIKYTPNQGGGRKQCWCIPNWLKDKPIKCVEILIYTI